LPILGESPAPREETLNPVSSAVVSAGGDLPSAIEPSVWPDEHELSRLVDARIFRLTIVAPLVLGAMDPKQTLEFLRLDRIGRTDARWRPPVAPDPAARRRWGPVERRL